MIGLLKDTHKIYAVLPKDVTSLSWHKKRQIQNTLQRSKEKSSNHKHANSLNTLGNDHNTSQNLDVSWYNKIPLTPIQQDPLDSDKMIKPQRLHLHRNFNSSTLKLKSFKAKHTAF